MDIFLFICEYFYIFEDNNLGGKYLENEEI